MEKDSFLQDLADTNLSKAIFFESLLKDHLMQCRKDPSKAKNGDFEKYIEKVNTYYNQYVTAQAVDTGC